MPHVADATRCGYVAVTAVNGRLASITSLSERAALDEIGRLLKEGGDAPLTTKQLGLLECELEKVKSELFQPLLAALAQTADLAMGPKLLLAKASKLLRLLSRCTPAALFEAALTRVSAIACSTLRALQSECLLTASASRVLLNFDERVDALLAQVAHCHCHGLVPTTAIISQRPDY